MLLDIGFINPIQHQTWLANIVPVKKKNWSNPYCVDFCDPNKACLKYEFALPNIAMLVDVSTSQSTSSFMDRFSDCSLIKMNPCNTEKSILGLQRENFIILSCRLG